MLKNNSALFAPLNHNGSETQPNPDSAFQVSMDRELPEKLTLYIPSNLDIDNILKDNTPSFKFHRDYFLYLLHLVTDIPSRNKDVEMDYVPFYSALIQRRVRHYRNYLDYLVDNGILIEDSQYIINKKSRGFRFSLKFQTPVKPVLITKKTLIKSILSFVNADYVSNEVCPIEDNTTQLNYLYKWYNNKLQVDYKSARSYLEKLFEDDLKSFDMHHKAMSKFNSRLITLEKLHRSEFVCSVDSTAGRLHTVLTQLKGDLRQFVTYDKESLVAVDITNSQPYLSTVLFNEEKYRENNILTTIKLYNKSFQTSDNFNGLPYYVSKNVKSAKNSENVSRYIDIVKSGQLYEEFGKILLNKGIITDDNSVRKQAKTIIFSSIFSPNQSISYNNSIKIFKDCFPDVYEIFRCIKQKEHRTLACLLQNLEAKLVLQTACKIISEKEPGIPLFTLHDAIITTKGNEKLVYEVLYDVLLNAVGIPPTLKFESWQRVAA